MQNEEKTKQQLIQELSTVRKRVAKLEKIKTEHKRAVKALRESEEKLRSLFDNAVEGIFQSTADGRLITANRAFAKLFGYHTPEEAIRNLSDITNQLYANPYDRKRVIELLSEKGFIKNFECPMIGKDGSIFWVVMNARLTTLPEGTPFCLEGFIVDITDRKRAEEALRESEDRYRELSIVDGLTQLYNSRYFYNQLKMEIDRTERYEQPLTLLFIDLDNFKQVNDAFGHIEGDQVLLRLAQVVKRQLRQTDSAYRYGGEEFTILLPMTTSKGGAGIAERIRTEFKKEIFLPEPGTVIHVTVSIGLGQYQPGEDMKAFVHRVDQCMYEAKKSGKDRVFPNHSLKND